VLPGAACTHHTARELCSWASWRSIARTGVTPMPAENSATGVWSSASTNVPRGAAVSMTSPLWRWVWRVGTDLAAVFAFDADPVLGGTRGRGQ
jgi:hypothetical protein